MSKKRCTCGCALVAVQLSPGGTVQLWCADTLAKYEVLYGPVPRVPKP